MTRERSQVGVLLRAEHGAVFAEHLIAYLPVLFLFVSTWQLIELFAAQLVVDRAASAAARAAVVVLPDDPQFYNRTAVNSFSAERRTDIRLAAAIVLATSPYFVGEPGVSIDLRGVSGNGNTGPLTATVRARFACFAGFMSLVCFGGTREIRSQATYAYQGARYLYM